MLGDLFGTEGRLGRLAYLAYTLLLDVVVIGGIWLLLGNAPKAWLGNWVRTVRDPDHTHLIVCIVFYLVVLRVSAALTMKRLHDVDLSGVFWFIFISVPVVVHVSGMKVGSQALMLVAALLYLALKAWLMLWPGTPGANSFGAQP
jgi:uncharacterized membrane protein YhaH (DUF805 family)